jgi:hypothetical protein
MALRRRDGARSTSTRTSAVRRCKMYAALRHSSTTPLRRRVATAPSTCAGVRSEGADVHAPTRHDRALRLFGRCGYGAPQCAVREAGAGVRQGAVGDVDVCTATRSAPLRRWGHAVPRAWMCTWLHDDARRLGAGGGVWNGRRGRALWAAHGEAACVGWGTHRADAVSAFPAASTTSEGLYLHGKHHLARAAPSARSLRAALGLPQLLSPRIFRPLPSLPFYCLPARLVALSTSPTAYRLPPTARPIQVWHRIAPRAALLPLLLQPRPPLADLGRHQRIGGAHCTLARDRREEWGAVSLGLHPPL